MALFGEVRTDCYWHWMNGRRCEMSDISVVHQPSDDSALTMGPFGTRFDRAHCTPFALRRITDYIRGK